MSSCTRLPTCSFYQGRMVTESGIGKILKAKYCECNNTTNCARFLIISKLGEKYLDDTLFPNMVDRAYEMIARHENDPKEEQPDETEAESMNNEPINRTENTESVQDDYVSLFLSDEAHNNTKTASFCATAFQGERVFDSVKNTAQEDEVATEEPFLRLRKNETPKTYLYPDESTTDYPYLSE